MFRQIVIAVGIAALPSGSSAQPSDPLAPSQPKVTITTKAIQRPVGSAPAIKELRIGGEETLVGFGAYKRSLSALAAANGVPPAIVAREMATVVLIPRVIELDRGQPGAIGRPDVMTPFEPYRRSHVTPSLISRGKARADLNAEKLARLERMTGVDPGVVMAIYGHETSYGAVTGGFDLLSSLATLAYEGRRRAFFEQEFVAALRLIQQGQPRSRLMGSYAGATGYPQFMPSTVLRLARDGDGDGVANIWSNEMDGLASIASYLRDAGWKANVPWGFAVRVPLGLDRQAIRSRLKAPRCPRVYQRHSQWKTLAEWRALGIVPQNGTRATPENEMLTLVEPDGPNATAYLLSQNYRAILDYNCSNLYALSVGLLADAIERR